MIIIEGILASLPGVMNAFLVLGILMDIWSIMGVEFFQYFEPMYLLRKLHEGNVRDVASGGGGDGQLGLEHRPCSRNP
jgi:hypothetical protein